VLLSGDLSYANGYLANWDFFLDSLAPIAGNFTICMANVVVEHSCFVPSCVGCAANALFLANEVRRTRCRWHIVPVHCGQSRECVAGQRQPVPGPGQRRRVRPGGGPGKCSAALNLPRG
jgi:hypothetical protein